MYLLYLFLVLFPAASVEIYGVRWFLGSHFAFTPSKLDPSINTTSSGKLNYYILAFNADERFEEDVYALVDNNVYTCSHRQINVQHVENPEYNETLNETVVSIYRCYITTDLRGEIHYEIYTSYPMFSFSQTGDEKVREVKLNRTQLFEGRFRAFWQPHGFHLSPKEILVMGDWGEIGDEGEKKGYVPTLPSMINHLEGNPRVCLALFMGDLAYDFRGTKYFSMLRYIQSITSRVAFMVTPGNHDYVYHEDAFELFAETFLSPFWEKNFNLYYSLVLADVMFISYNPEEIMYKESDREEINVNALKAIKKDFPEEQYQKIADKYHVIAFSHYPLYCSDKTDSLLSCFKSRQNLKDYLDIFYGMGLDYYMAGHVHTYERSHSIVETYPGYKVQLPKEKTVDKFIKYEEYDSSGTIYVVEGDAGNNDEVLTEAQETQDYTAATSLGTGFGVLTLYREDDRTTKIGYEHHSVKTVGHAQVDDRCIKIMPGHDPQSEDGEYSGTVTQGTNTSFTILEIVIVIAVTCVIGLLCWRSGLQAQLQQADGPLQSGTDKDHIQMVQEQFDAGRETDDGKNT